MSENNHRRCAKCRKTRAEDMTVTYHRFPTPGSKNITKARAWAKYCWPNQDWSPVESLQSLHTSNKVLCGRHFNLSQFYDNLRQKLSRFAVPDSIESHNSQENLLHQDERQSSVTGQLSSRVPFTQIENMEVEHATVLDQQTLVHTPQQDEKQSSVTGHLSSRVPFTQIDNMEVEHATHVLDQQTLVHTSNTFKSATIEQTMKTPVPEVSTIKEIHVSHIEPQSSKKQSGILSSLNVTKLSELTSRELKLYEICKKKIKEIMRLRKQMKAKKTKNFIKTLQKKKMCKNSAI